MSETHTTGGGTMNRKRGAGQPPIKRPWGHKRIGRLGLEHDGSMVIGNQVVPVDMIAPDYMDHEEQRDVVGEVVRRWNAHAMLIEACRDAVRVIAQCGLDESAAMVRKAVEAATSGDI